MVEITTSAPISRKHSVQTGFRTSRLSYDTMFAMIIESGRPIRYEVLTEEGREFEYVARDGALVTVSE